MMTVIRRWTKVRDAITAMGVPEATYVLDRIRADLEDM